MKSENEKDENMQRKETNKQKRGKEAREEKKSTKWQNSLYS